MSETGTLQVLEETLPLGLVVRLEGSASMHQVQVLEREMNRLAAGRPKLIILDLTRLEFIASLAMGQIVALNRTIKRFGGRVLIAGASDSVAKSFRHARLDTLMPMFATRDEAIAGATTSPPPAG